MAKRGNKAAEPFPFWWHSSLVYATGVQGVYGVVDARVWEVWHVGRRQFGSLQQQRTDNKTWRSTQACLPAVASQPSF